MNVGFDIDPQVLASLHQDTGEFVREMRIAAAVKWYELHRLSQGRAAEVAGLSRAEFLDALGRYRVTPFQQTTDDLVADVAVLERPGT
jgi:predicted HTH domain antitoxin